MAAPGFIHDLIVENCTGASTDAEGRTTRAFTDSAPIRGRAAMVSFDEAQRGGGNGQNFSAVALLPLGTAVALEDRVRVPSEAGEFLAGTYEVVAVRPNPLHLRAMLRRWEP